MLDFDPEKGVLRPGSRFVPPPAGADVGSYSVDASQVESGDFLRTSAFASVLKTMYMFEEGDTLGRRLTWGFGGPQLLVVPVAGEWANAFYERESHRRPRDGRCSSDHVALPPPRPLLAQGDDGHLRPLGACRAKASGCKNGGRFSSLTRSRSTRTPPVLSRVLRHPQRAIGDCVTK